MLKQQMSLSVFLLVGVLVLSACAGPAPTLAPDAADCSNLSSTSPTIKIESSWARATDSGETTSALAAPAMGTGSSMGGSIKTAAFMVIHNCGTQADTLVKAKSNLDGMTTLMSFEVKDGKSAMMDVSQIDIPAGKKVELKSGGYHIMFMNLKNDLKPGFPLELTLTFKNAGDIKLTPTVKISREANHG
jgi:periplasmic copper chaperone A